MEMFGYGRKAIPFLFTTYNNPEFIRILSDLTVPIYGLYPVRNSLTLHNAYIGSMGKNIVCIPLWTDGLKKIKWQRGEYRIRSSIRINRGALFDIDNPGGFITSKYIDNITDLLHDKDKILHGQVAKVSDITGSLWKNRRHLKFIEIKPDGVVKDYEKYPMFLSGDYNNGGNNE